VSLPPKLQSKNNIFVSFCLLKVQYCSSEVLRLYAKPRGSHKKVWKYPHRSPKRLRSEKTITWGQQWYHWKKKTEMCETLICERAMFVFIKHSRTYWKSVLEVRLGILKGTISSFFKSDSVIQNACIYLYRFFHIPGIFCMYYPVFPSQAIWGGSY
jgi:hypothetical protein